MSSMSTWLIQKEYANSPESRAVLQTALLDDDHIVRANLEDLGDPDIGIAAIPVGSVEFVREYAAQIGVMLPQSMDYPEDLRPYLGRSVRKMCLCNVPEGAFLKPARTKQFSAIHHYDPGHPPNDLSPDTPCWASEHIDFSAEYRFYVLDHALLGWSQYDAGRECGVSSYELTRIDSMILAWRMQPHAWALDVGRLPDGHLALVEVNDAWATGYYPGGVHPRDYARWLKTRWHEIVRIHGPAI